MLLLFRFIIGQPRYAEHIRVEQGEARCPGQAWVAAKLFG